MTQKKFSLEAIIKDIEERNGTIDLNDRRYIFLIESAIERYYSDDLRKLKLIEQVLKSVNFEDSLYNSAMEYTNKRYK